MTRDKTKDNCYHCEQQLDDVERQLEELHIQERHLAQSLEELHYGIRSSIKRLIDIEDELSIRSHGNYTYIENEDRGRQVRQLIETYYKEQEIQFQKRYKELECKRENFIKERNRKKWD